MCHLFHYTHPVDRAMESEIPSTPTHFLHHHIPHWSSSPLQDITLAPKDATVFDVAVVAISVATATYNRLEANFHSSSAFNHFFAISQPYPYISFTICLAFKLTMNARCVTIIPIFPSNRTSRSLRHSLILISIPHQITADLIARTVTKLSE